MDNKIYMVMEKDQIVGIKFRGKVYEVKDKTSTEAIEAIIEEHPDFMDIYNEAIKNGGIVKISGESIKVKPTKTFKSNMKKGLKTRLAALGLAGALGAGAIFAACSNKETAENNKTNTEQVLVEEDNLMDYINQLEEGIQKESWLKINSFQRYFNNTAAKTVSIKEDNEAQLYLTAEQCVALFTRLNADRLTPEEMATIFGNSSYFNLTNLDEDFTKACEILTYYYMTATNTSGINRLFVDETDRQAFIEFEKLVLNYNGNRTDENKNKIVEQLDNIFLSGDISGIKENNKGVASAIGSAMLPALELTYAVDSEKADDIIRVNETITCNILREYLKQAIEIKDEINVKKQGILEIMPDILDQYNIKVDNINIDLNARFEQIVREVFGEELDYSIGSVYNPSSNNISVNQTVTINTQEESEQEALEEFEEEYSEENKKEEAYGQGLNAIANSLLYDEAYNYVAKNGTKPSVSNYSSIINSIKNSYSGPYTSSFNSGVDAGAQNTINNAYNDAIVEYNARNNNDTKYETEEEYIPQEELEQETVSTPEPTIKPVVTPEPTQALTTEKEGSTIVEEEYIPQEELEQTVIIVEEPVITPAPVVEEPVTYSAPETTYEEPVVIVEEEYISQEELEQEAALVRTR